MRREWTQREVIEIANLLGFKNFDRRSIEYWTRMGVFPEPKTELKNVLVFYDDERVDCAMVDISKRLRQPLPITYEDVASAKSEVLKSNKAKNVNMFLRKLRERKQV